jgi:DNA polymerase-4
VSHEHTFDVDTADAEVIERTILALSEGVASRLRASGIRASTVAVKVRDSTFRTVTRQRTLPEPTDLADEIFHAALALARPETRGRRIRLIGVGAHGLGEPAQLGLFASEDPRRRKAVEAQDAIRRKYGTRALTRARLIGDPLSDPGGRDPMRPPDRPDSTPPAGTRDPARPADDSPDGDADAS